MINIIFLEKAQIAFQLLFIILFRCTTTTCHLNLYNTDYTNKHNDLQYDCLDYYFYHEEIAYQELRNIINEIISYCFRPVNTSEKLLEASVNPVSQNLNFQELLTANITSQQLLTWSVPINVVERYQLYLHKPNLLLNEYFYNCTKPWFGLQCQYSFELDESISFSEIVESIFHQRQSYIESFDITVQVPCYVLLECHRRGQAWCLDWREVCDGHIDCFDEDSDEKFCFDMEMNECGENEYRCHNGLCIPDKLWGEGQGEAYCLDRSDELTPAYDSHYCFQDPTFRCEEHTCRDGMEIFSCGDGECVLKSTNCHNGRHMLIFDYMAVKGNLTDKCWIAMVCLTKLSKQVNGTLCETWLMNNSTYEYLEQCDSFFLFPSVPVESSHVYFYYEDRLSKLDSTNFYLPDYVCYDYQLCDFTTPQIVRGNLTCMGDDVSIINADRHKNPWLWMIMRLENYFRFCLIPSARFQNKTNYSNHPSLFNCANSSKFISKHRIKDDVMDCFRYDDESYENSCLLNDKYRVKCSNEEACWTFVSPADACKLEHVQNREEIPFRNFCDGMKLNYFTKYNGTELTDEDGCQDKWCDNIYARCDHFWACPDGQDERNCTETKCPSGTLACLSPLNYTVFCLPSEYVGDYIEHCVGGTDEQENCRTAFLSTESFLRFHCLNSSTTCLRSSQLCNGVYECVEKDDEAFCTNDTFSCEKSPLDNYSEVEEIFCEPNEGTSRRYRFFSVDTSREYPSPKINDANEIIQWPVNQRTMRNVNLSQDDNVLWPWYCNRGLVVRTWNENNTVNKTCMCPPSYYGHLCQYQNQRISLTLRLTAVDRQATYAVISMLMDDDDGRREIDAYDQFLYIPKQSCSIRLNRYLLFSTRPKNSSKNYSVCIDVFEKNRIKYVGSWHFSIDFLFLPVNRLTVPLEIPNNAIQTSSNCTVNCENGKCIKYINKEKYFCRCFSGWSGIQCSIPINCQACMFDSMCIGSSKNQSVCVCPLGKFGSRCLLELTCPIDPCENNGKCIPANVNIHGSGYTCICPQGFFGQNCQYSQAKVDVTFNNIYVPSHIVAYFFTLSNTSDPISTIILRKLTLFQTIATFRISIQFHMMFIQVSNKYYLAVLQRSPNRDISTSISSTQECVPSEQLFNSTVLKMFRYERIVYYYALCGERHDLTCFIDEDFLCLCTNDHHANCVAFKRYIDFECSLKDHCDNEAQCLQDHPICPSTRICVCPQCFFGNQCQFYAKGLGSTLDEILGYEFKRNIILSKQPFTVKVSAVVTMLIFLIGIINGILSIMTFSRKKTQEVGCGIYLLASSITSLSTVTLFTLKFWLLFLSHQNLFGQHGQQFILNANCMCIEPLLKLALYLDNWFNACVAIERTMTVAQGIRFDKNKSKQIARSIIILLILIITCLFIPQLLNLHVFEDKTEERTWCVVTYRPWLQLYSSILIFFHYFAPLLINVFSAIFIIITSARKRTISQVDRSFWSHLRIKLSQYKHLIISPIIIIILTLPHLIISIILDCNKSSNLFWFYLIGYFLSFIPATIVFIIFVIPSTLYRKEFKQIMQSLPFHQNFEVLKFIPAKI